MLNKYENYLLFVKFIDNQGKRKLLFVSWLLIKTCLNRNFMKTFHFFIILFLPSLFFGSGEAYAAKKIKKKSKTSVTTNKSAALVINTETGSILHQEYADVKRYPASLTKLMTLYLTFEALNSEKLHLTDAVKVSRHAASQPRMSIALKENDKITVQTLIDSLVVVSANDSAVVLAEKIGKSEWNFALMMTARARELGMKNTTFRNASGLFDAKQVTTARDMATLMIAMKRDFPEYYEMLSALNFSYKGVKYNSHTNVMKVCPWAKAGKTGYVRASGFNLVIGAEKGRKSIVAVVMGGVTAKSRDAKMINLINKSF